MLIASTLHNLQGNQQYYEPNFEFDEEAIAEAKADAYTAAQQEATAACNLWALYDEAVKAKAAGNAKATAKAEKKLASAKANADKYIAKLMKKAAK